MDGRQIRVKTMLGFKIFEFVWTGQLSYPQYLARARQECEDSSRPSGTPAPGRNHSPGSGSNMCHSRWLLACEQPLLFGRAPRERASEGQSREGPPTPLPPRSRLPLACLSHVYFNDIPKRRACSLATILVKTFGTRCVLGEENVLQVDPPPP